MKNPVFSHDSRALSPTQSLSIVRFFVLATALMLACNVVSAQYGYIPTTRTINTPYGPAKINDYRYSPMHMYYGNPSISQKYTFTIVLQSDSLIKAPAKIDIDEKQHVLKFKYQKSKHELKPSDTKEIFRISSTGVKYQGIPADSCWLFKSVTGKINGYGIVAESGYSYIVAIQQGEGAIVSLTKEALEPMIRENEKAMKYFEKKKYTSAIQAFNTAKD
jgi:hypothetical protein